VLLRADTNQRLNGEKKQYTSEGRPLRTKDKYILNRRAQRSQRVFDRIRLCNRPNFLI
jgi:hypothetical protein